MALQAMPKYLYSSLKFDRMETGLISFTIKMRFKSFIKEYISLLNT